MAARDILYIVIIIFMFAIGFFVIHYVVNQTVNRMVTNTVINSSASAVDAINTSKTMANKLDYIILGVFIAVILGLIITGWFIGGNPIFMFIYFIVIIIAIVLSMIFSNVWATVSEMSIFGTTINYFPITNHILSHFALYIAVIGILGLIVMFAKPFVAQGAE